MPCVNVAASIGLTYNSMASLLCHTLKHLSHFVIKKRIVALCYKHHRTL